MLNKVNAIYRIACSSYEKVCIYLIKAIQIEDQIYSKLPILIQGSGFKDRKLLRFTEYANDKLNASRSRFLMQSKCKNWNCEKTQANVTTGLYFVCVSSI